ncbi:DUF1294 domain-containing protein [Halofilum ochraceum]|uniref:DUF1294 domain-containing protein n=1 Tax=Halofilum ochraceum TaxID=1611323 RepID=UPI0008D99B3A|nr:cold shock and DUF1294 domain-containing protein [Halofilum ochraceum]
MRQQGKVTSWNDAKGFGFITPSNGGAPVFVHISAFPRGRRPMANDAVTYSVTRDARKRLKAEKVLHQQRGTHDLVRARGLIPALFILAAFFAAILYSVVSGRAPLAVVGFYALMSVVSFVMYALDKAAAKRGGWRTTEASLHLVELIGGWPGALVAQRVFRHKTRKQPFQFIFWSAVVANMVALAWLLLSDGASDLRATFGIG